MFTSKIFQLTRFLPIRELQIIPKNVRTFGKETVHPENSPMEKTINQVTLLGRVGSEPKKKGTEEHPMIIFSLATHSSFKQESGEITQRTDWHRVCVFKPSLRDLVFMYLKKGQRIHVSGRLTYGSTKEDSTYRPTSSIVADDIIFFHSSEA